MKKAVSVGTSAALLASLFTAIVAGPVAASVTATSAGTFAPGTTSANAVTFTFTETSAAALANAAGSLTVTLTDSAGNPTVTFTGTPSTAGSTGSLGASASVAGNVLTVSWSASDPGSVETIIVSGLKLKASNTAAVGPIRATLGGGGAFFTAPTTVSVSGTLVADLAAGGATVGVQLASACPFTATGGVASQVQFSDASDPRNITVAAPVAGVQPITFVAGTLTHPAGTTVTQTAAYAGCTVLPSAVGVIANALGYSSAGNPNVFPGESNSGPAGNLTLTEPAADFLTDGTTVTLTIKTPGVLFSTRPIATVTAGNLAISGSFATAANEVQTVTVAGAAGTFTLSFGGQTTAALPFNETITNVQTALQGLTSIGAGNVLVTGVPGAYVLTFAGTLAAENVAQVTGVGTGGATVTVGTTTEGVTAGAELTLSADRTAASFKVSGDDTIASTVVISNIFYDVASTVAGGTFVDVQVTAGGKLVNPTDNTNAVVGRGLNATATPTTVFIGQNAQKTGLVTVTELAAGFFQGGTGTNNTIEVCLINNAETFTSPGPSAKVTAGDLVLRSGNAAAAAGAAVPGTAVFFPSTGDTCYTWKVWTASTAVSTITIGNSDFSSGPLVDVPANSTPGAVNMAIFVGNGDVIPTSAAVAATVQIATAVFQNQVAVTALSQPTIARGSTDALAGNIQVAETAAGQLKLGESICVEVLPRTSNETFQDTYLKALNTADIPVATASGGVLVGPVTMSSSPCRQQPGTSTAPGAHTVSFSFPIQQQSVNGTGKVVISNIHYVTTADAPNGPVLVNVFGLGVLPTSVQFQATISNATIGTAGVADAWIAKGLNVRTASAFTLATASVKRGTYVTIRAKSSNAPAGTLGQIWVKTKTTAWHLESSRRVGTDGFLYYSGKVLNLGYRYYKVAFVAGGTSNTVRGFGK